MGSDRQSSDRESRLTRYRRTRTISILKGLVILLLLFTLPALWSWTPINLATIIEWQEAVKHYPAAFYLVVGAYLLGSLFLVGAARIRFWDFFLASVIGRIPGIVLLTLAGLQVEMFFRQPGVIGLVLLGLTLILVPLAFGWASKRLLLRKPRQPDSFKSSPRS